MTRVVINQSAYLPWKGYFDLIHDADVFVITDATPDEAQALLRDVKVAAIVTIPADFSQRVAAHEPIGSGVTEAACKVIVKQRLCGSGMKWKEAGAAAVLSLRCLSYTRERWGQFWSKIDRWGFPVAA